MDSENTPPRFSNAKICSAEQSVHLPEEIIGEILSRLSVKLLLKLRCVSKSWLSLIGSKFFINKHFQNSTKSKSLGPTYRLIFNGSAPGLKQLRSYSYLLGSRNIHPMRLDLVVGHCNGLLCIIHPSSLPFFVRNPATSFFLRNPATKISIKLPKIDHVFRKRRFGWDEESSAYKCGFGWDEESGAYKMFVGMSDRKGTIAQVYSSKTNSWKTVEHGSICRSVKVSGIFACGKIHWLTGSGKHIYIESFDLKSEVFGMIEIPCKPEVGVPLWMWERGGCLCVVMHNNNNKCTTWAMKEYGVKESWVKLSTPPCTQQKFSFDNVFDYIESLVSPVDATRVAKRQNKRRLASYGVEGNKESQEIIQQDQVHAQGRPKRLNRRRPARYDT